MPLCEQHDCEALMHKNLHWIKITSLYVCLQTSSQKWLNYKHLHPVTPWYADHTKVVAACPEHFTLNVKSVILSITTLTFILPNDALHTRILSATTIQFFFSDFKSYVLLICQKMTCLVWAFNPLNAFMHFPTSSTFLCAVQNFCFSISPLYLACLQNVLWSI